MGSQSRKLRVKAGVSGEARRRQRSDERFERERAAEAEQRASRSMADAWASKKSRAEAEMRRLLDEMAKRSGPTNEERQAACIDPALYKSIAEQARVFELPLPEPLHWADYLSELEGKAVGFSGQVCRVCGKAKPVSVRPGPPASEVVINAGMGPMTAEQLMDTGGLPLAVAAEHPSVTTTVRGDGELPAHMLCVSVDGTAAPYTGAFDPIEMVEIANGPKREPRPPAAGMRLARQPGAARRLLPLLALLSMTAGLAIGPPKGDR